MVTLLYYMNRLNGYILQTKTNSAHITRCASRDAAGSFIENSGSD